MTTMDTGTSVKSDFTRLKMAVSAVTKANKSWLLALEGFLEGIDPNTTDSTQKTVNQSIAAVITAALPGLSSVNPQGSSKDMPIDQALRLALDELTLLQLADRKLEGRILRLDNIPESLSKAVVEAEAYLVMTDEAFSFLTNICAGVTNSSGVTVNGLEKIKGIDSAFQSSLTTLQTAADDARNKSQTGLAPTVSSLLQSIGSAGTVTLPRPEPEGTELLLGKSFGQCADKFLALMPAGSRELTQTQTLLSGGRLTLSNNQINALTNSWGKVVKKVTDDLAGSSPTFTIADLFCIHTTLDTLYDRLETDVTRSDIDIVSTEI